MSLLFSTLPDGCFHLEKFITNDQQDRLVMLSRTLVKTHPLVTPTTRAGYDMALKVTSWGKVGWFGQNGHYSYLDKHPMHNMPWPPIPKMVNDIMQMALVATGYPTMGLDTVLLNWYPTRIGKLGRHQDITEEDKVSPIVTISLGDGCMFNVGSMDYNDQGVNFILCPGDVVVMGGKSRLAYHEVKWLADMQSNPLKGGRISLTGRRVFK